MSDEGEVWVDLPDDAPPYNAPATGEVLVVISDAGDYDPAHRHCPDCTGWGWRPGFDDEGNEWTEPCDHRHDTGRPGGTPRIFQDAPD